MKKIAIISVLVGLSFVGLAYFYSLKSSELIRDNLEYDSIKNTLQENQQIALADEISEIKNGDFISNQFIELSESEYKDVTMFVDQFNNDDRVDPLFSNAVVDLIEKDFSELGFIKSIIGSSIDYGNFSFDYSFLPQLFKEDASLSDLLTLSFLNRYRNSDLLLQTYERYKEDIYHSIPKSLYQKVFVQQINDCLLAYEEIAKKTDKKAFFEDIYFKANSQNLHRKYWKYTFWKRREIEKNDNEIYSILSEIKDHYEKL